EQWGLIRARERSGYYVAPGATPEASPAAKRRASRAGATRKVDISNLVFSVLDAATQPGIVPLGSAFPSP
ncbi:hypothetical protein NO135_26300, partial [Clostridioides difficile]|nr:hypothetical protein [Clostridioides difficile]